MTLSPEDAAAVAAAAKKRAEAEGLELPEKEVLADSTPPEPDEIALLVVDEDGKPIANQVLALKPADGSTRDVATNKDGKALVSKVAQGDAVVSILGTRDIKVG